ncbi:TetR/AcrR family transcriptional regulator [Methylophilus sp. 5]|uniref:TetR/AcrR family transcriptional regulator n=1 Tax=Methylophilus sp. 5 TaxID=1112274 RepID=UPI00048C6A9B|nr:TetR/AcrR family transcriptional regulator [Methylophilus sp. 5]
MSNISPKRPRGRPRSFDKDQALSIALDLFRKKGFDNTSLDDLTTALNVNKPSLYAAFGNKEQLFLEVLHAYTSGPTAYFHAVFEEPTTQSLVRMLLVKSIELLFYNESPAGCLVVMSTASEALQKVGIQQKLVAGLQQHQQKLIARFEQAKADGELKATVDSQRLALYVVTLHKGLSLQAINGSSKEDMLQLVEQVIDLWPSTR